MNIEIENASWSSEVGAQRIFNICAYTPDGDYIIGSEFSDNDPYAVAEWFTHEFAEEIGDLESAVIKVEHVGYTVCDFDDCIDLYL